MILLDVSASTRQSPWRDPAWVRKLAEARLGPERRVTVVGFDGELPDIKLRDARIEMRGVAGRVGGWFDGRQRIGCGGSVGLAV